MTDRSEGIFNVMTESFVQYRFLLFGYALMLVILAILGHNASSF